MIDEAAIAAWYRAVSPLFDERARRLTAGSEALAIGRGWVAAVSRATGLARTTVQRGMDDVLEGGRLDRLLHRSVVFNIDGDSYRMRAHQARPSTSERGWSSGQAVKLVRPVRGSSAWGVSLIESGEFRESATRLPGRDPHEPYRHETLYHQPDAVHGEWNYSLLPRQWLLLTEAVIS